MTKEYAGIYVNEILPEATILVKDIKEVLHFYVDCEQDVLEYQVPSILKKVTTNLKSLSKLNKQHMEFIQRQ